MSVSLSLLPSLFRSFLFPTFLSCHSTSRLIYLLVTFTFITHSHPFCLFNYLRSNFVFCIYWQHLSLFLIFFSSLSPVKNVLLHVRHCADPSHSLTDLQHQQVKFKIKLPTTQLNRWPQIHSSVSFSSLLSVQLLDPVLQDLFL